MAYKSTNFGPMHNAAQSAAPCLFVYWNETADTLTGAGYFPQNAGIKNGDLVLVLAKDSATAPKWHKLAVADTGVVTATALS